MRTRVLTKPAAPAPIEAEIARGVGFLSMKIAICSASISVLTSKGTTAPFSAISGAFSLTFSLEVTSAVPNKFSIAAVLSFASNASLLQAAQAILGSATAATNAPPRARSTDRRSIVFS